METLSKTARASLPTARETGFQPTSDIPLLISCANGAFAYLRDPRTGLVSHLATNSNVFVAQLDEICRDGHADRVESELSELGWDQVRRSVAQALTA